MIHEPFTSPEGEIFCKQDDWTVIGLLLLQVVCDIKYFTKVYTKTQNQKTKAQKDGRPENDIFKDDRFIGILYGPVH